MLEINRLFGYLTGLVEEHRKTDNFFQALKYRKNFFKINTLMEKLKNKFDEIDVLECFDYSSDDEFVRTFRSIIIKEKTGLYEYLSQLDEVESVSILKENIIIIIK